MIKLVLVFLFPRLAEIYFLRANTIPGGGTRVAKAFVVVPIEF